MAGLSGRGTTYNLPNYHGMLMQLTPSDTRFLSAIGGLTGGKKADSTEFSWGAYDLRDASQTTRLEGADAPTAEERVRSEITNVVQIHQEAIDVSYTKLAAVGQFAGSNNNGANPVLDEAQFQIETMLKQIARDVEFSLLRGTYVKPGNNATARKTRGLLEAIVTNVLANGGTPRALTEALVLQLLQDTWEEGGIQEEETATLIAGATQKRALTKIFVTDKGYSESSRNVGGVNLQTIETDFGKLNIMLNRFMPADKVAVASLDQCAPVFLEIPDKGFLFVEPLAKVGASDRSQIYGEVGLEYGNEKAHGRIDDLS